MANKKEMLEKRIDLDASIHGAKTIIVDGICLPERYRLFADAIENFEVHNDDVYLCGFPKSGTTWLQELVWCVANDLNFEGAKDIICKRFPSMLASIQRPPTEGTPPWYQDSVEYCRTLPRPRYIKTHLPFNLLPLQIRRGEKSPKIIHITRNPKDVCISLYHFLKLTNFKDTNFPDHCTEFLTDQVYFTPYWKNVNSYLENRDQHNILSIRYEDMKEDLPAVIRTTASFLNKKLDEKQVSALVDHLSFAKMKNNPAVDHHWLKHSRNNEEFIRKGTIGQWKTDMDEQTVRKFDEWTKKNCSKVFTF